MAAVTISSDLGAPQNKVWHCFHCLPIYFPWVNVSDFEFGNDFLSMIPKAQATKHKIDKVYLIKTKILYIWKDTIN